MSVRHKDDTSDYPDDSEVGAPRITNNYYQTKAGNGNGNGNGYASKLNSVLFAIIVSIIAFLGVQIWNMSDRLARVETNVTTLLNRP